MSIPSYLNTHPCVLLQRKMGMMAHTCNTHLHLHIELNPVWATGKSISINQTIFHFSKEVSGLQQN